jgi:NAD(P)-dependent dehydrogenase (short-subunit alcohol dehydrogenase family)
MIHFDERTGMNLKGKRALITGGTSGIGSATARAMAQEGASVIITGRDEGRGATAADEIRQAGGDARFLAADLTRADQVSRVAREAGDVDILVNCAGFYAVSPIGEVDSETFDRHFLVNVKAPFFLVGALAPGMAARGGGSIINVSTMVASFGQPGMSAYGASRAALELLTKAWAAEYGPQGIRANAVAPGPTRTPAMEPVMAMAEELVKSIPLGRVAETHEVSDVITFLATPAAGYINGAVIHVDGGRTAV